MPQEAKGKRGVPSETRNKPERPRDLLGRPLAWGADNQLELENYDALSVEENHELGRQYMREERFFPAHEAWETAWKQARGSGDEEFFKGLSQMGAGYTHLRRGNPHGTMVLLRRAAGRIGRYPDPHRGIATASLRQRLLSDASLVEAGQLVPSEDATVEPVPV